MLRRTSALVALALAGAAAIADPAHAGACVAEPINYGNLTAAIEGAEVIAVGTFEDAEGDRLHFQVEEGLKNAPSGAQLSVNNATALRDCQEGHEPGRRNYAVGVRMLVFLERDTFGIADYKVARQGVDAYRVNGHFLDPADGAVEGTRLPSLDYVRHAVYRAPGAPPVRPGDELDPVAAADPGKDRTTWTAVAAISLVGVALLAAAAAMIVRRRGVPPANVP